ERGVTIDLIGIRRVDLEIARQMAHDVSEQDHASDGHDRLFSNRRFVETHHSMKRCNHDSTHAEILVALEVAGADEKFEGLKVHYRAITQRAFSSPLLVRGAMGL